MTEERKIRENNEPKDSQKLDIGFHYGTGGDEDYSGMVDNSPDRHKVPNISSAINTPLKESK